VGGGGKRMARHDTPTIPLSTSLEIVMLDTQSVLSFALLLVQFMAIAVPTEARDGHPLFSAADNC
jgi:hypothetical protein